jgi:DNA-binding MarR family transcriptional regulator
MQRLLQDGLIELSIDANNKRSKFVVLSKKGQRRYQTLSTLMTDASTA